MALFRTGPRRYFSPMKQLTRQPVGTTVKIAAGFVVLAVATGVAFAAWIDNGAGIFMAMIESGLAWCF